MKRTILILLLSRPGWGEPPWIVERAQGWALQPPAAVEHSLKAVEGNFRPWSMTDYNSYVRGHYRCTPHQLPYAVVGDFNGDGLPDLIVDGRTDKATLRLSLLSPSYQARAVESRPLKDPKQISYEVPGNGGKLEKQAGLWAYLEFLPAAKLSPHVDGFAEVFFMKTTIFYQLRGGIFKEIYNAD